MYDDDTTESRSGADPSATQTASIAVLADESNGTSTKWSEVDTDEERTGNMSKNHNGEAINVLWLDYHVSRESRANIGVADSEGNPDNIYATGLGEDATGRTFTSHTNKKDSFVDGPFDGPNEDKNEGE